MLYFVGTLFPLSVHLWRAFIGETLWPEAWAPVALCGVLCLTALLAELTLPTQLVIRVRRAVHSQPASPEALSQLLQGAAIAIIILPLFSIWAALGVGLALMAWGFWRWARKPLPDAGAISSQWPLLWRSESSLWMLLIGASQVGLQSTAWSFFREPMWEGSLLMLVFALALHLSSVPQVARVIKQLPPSLLQASAILPLAGAFLLPAILRPQYFSSPDPIIGLIAALAICVGVPVLLMATRWRNAAALPSWKLFWVPMALGHALGCAVVNSFGAKASLLVVALLGVVLETLVFRKVKWQRALSYALSCAVLTFYASQHGVAPPHERIKAIAYGRGHQWSVVEDVAQANFGLRRDFHDVEQSWKQSAEYRRRTLLPLSLRRDAHRVLIVGGQNPLGISAMLEHYPAELWIVDPLSSRSETARWFTSAEASSNRLTQSHRVVGDARSLLELSKTAGDYFDLVIVEALPTYQIEGSWQYDAEFFAKLRDRTLPTSVVAVWMNLQDLTEGRLAQAWADFRSVFGSKTLLFRNGLGANSLALGLLYLPSGKSDEGKRLPVRDALIGAPMGAEALTLADDRVLTARFSGKIRGSGRSWTQWPQWLARSSLERWLPADLGEPELGANYILGFLADKSPESASAGGLLWTRALVKKARGDSTWLEDKRKAVAQMLFDPSEDFPDLRDDPGAKKGVVEKSLQRVVK